MPYLGQDDSYEAAPLASVGTPSLSDYQAGAQMAVPQYHNGFVTALGTLAMAPVDLIDTASSSLGITDRGSINRSMLNALDMPGVYDFYNQNRAGIEAVSGIGGLIASDLIARRLTEPASIFMKGLRQIPYLRRVAALDEAYTASMATVRNVDSALAARGAIGAEQYTGRAMVNTSLWNADTGAFVAATREVSRDAAVVSARRLGFTKGAVRAGATEAVSAITLNQNGFLYFDDFSTNLAFAALGVGVGGAFERLATSFQIRKFVNSDGIRRTFASALDPEGIEDSRLMWHGRALPGDAAGPATFFGGGITDLVTSLLLNASTLKEAPITGVDNARALMASRDALATQQLQLAREETQKLTTKGISTNGFTRFSMDSRGFGNHVDLLTYRDPSALYGVEMLGGIGDDMSIHAVHNSHVARIDERIKQTETQLDELAARGDPKDESEALQVLRRRLAYEKTLTPMAVIDGEFMPISEAEAIEGFVEPGAPLFTPADRRKPGPAKIGIGRLQQDRHGLWEAVTESPRGGVSIDSDFIYHLPGKKNLDTADHFEILRLYRTANHAIEQMKNFKGAIHLPKNPDWFQLDMAEEILRRSDGRANVVFPSGMNRETAQIESMLGKSKGLTKWANKERTLQEQAEAAGETYEGQLSKLRVRYNVPRLTAYERGVTGVQEHAVEQLMRGLNTFGEDEARKMSLTELKESAAQFKRIGDMAPTSAKDMESLSGTSFRYMLDESGQPVKPLIAYKRPFQIEDWSQDYLADRLAAGKLGVLTNLTAADAAGMTRSISQSVVNSPDFAAASKTNELMDVQIQGGVLGSAPQSVIGAAGNAIRTSEWRDRDNPIMLAATRIFEGVNRQVRDFMKITVENAFADRLAILKNPRNAASKLLLDQFHTFRSGWDLAKSVEGREGGFHAFTLADTKENRDRFRRVFGRDMAKGQSLLSPSGKEVVLDDLALDVQSRFNQVTEALRGEKNTLLRANGRGEIDRLDWYTPPPNTNGKFIGFVMGPDGKVVPGMTVVEATPEAFARSKAAMTAKLDNLGMGYVFRTQDEIREFASVWDKAQMEFIDPGTTAIQPNKRAKGALTGAEVRTDAFDESLQHTRDGFLRHGDDLIQTLFRDQINATKARANIATETTRNRAGFYRDQKFRSIYDMYLENLLGKSKLNSSGSLVGRIANPIEGTIDQFLSQATPSVSRTWTAMTSWVNKSIPWSKTQQARRDFDALTEKLGEHMPFESATQMLERQGAGATPVTVAKITGGINRFSAAMLLRILEVAHPIMNLSGIVNAMPAVVRNYLPRAGETAEELAARVGHSATIFNLGDGRHFGVLDMSKLGTRAINRAWNPTTHPYYAEMVKRGMLTQEVAEFQRQFGAINTKGRMMRFFTGDPTSPHAFARKGLVGWMSILSDKSEDFSRSWGTMVGLELADELGIHGMDNQLAFAHDIANKMIANYAPHNRPEIFQGALGAPLGLFQSFIMNYYQRLFRYIETKDYRALATQYGMQGALFGVTGLPGFQTLQSFMSAAGEDDDLGTGVQRRFQGPLGEWIGGGVLSNIPKLWGGAPVDLYSRGDTNVRVPGVGTNTVPGVQVVSKIISGLSQGFAQWWSGNPGLSLQQVAEIASNSISNRPIAGMIEQFALGGDDVDPSGQLVSETINDSEHWYRMIGLRSMRQSQEIAAFYANRNAMGHKAANDEVLRLATRTAIRSGNMDSLPNIFQQYLTNGGDPRNFRRWIRTQYEAATQTRSERQLQQALRNPQRMAEVVRLLDAGVTPSQDEAADPSGYSPQGQDPLNQMDQPPGDLQQYPGQMTIPPQGAQ